MMKYRIEQIESRWVIGMSTQTSYLTINEDTKRIAQSFMPRRSEVLSRIGKHVYSIQNFGPDFNPNNPKSTFEKWVGVEVGQIEKLPQGMHSFLIASGTYAIFSFKGSITGFPQARAYIFREWLPNSAYELDQKAHFEILGEDYSKDFGNVEEEIWIPIKRKV